MGKAVVAGEETRNASCGSAGVCGGSTHGTDSMCNKGSLPGCPKRDNAKPVRDSGGPDRWRMGPYYRRSLVTEVEGRGPASERTHETARAAEIDDESIHSAEFGSDAAEGVPGECEGLRV